MSDVVDRALSDALPASLGNFTTFCFLFSSNFLVKKKTRSIHYSGELDSYLSQLWGN